MMYKNQILKLPIDEKRFPEGTIFFIQDLCRCISVEGKAKDSPFRCKKYVVTNFLCKGSDDRIGITYLN